MKNWIKYFLKKANSDKSYSEVVEYLSDKDEDFKQLAVRSIIVKQGKTEKKAIKIYNSIRRNYFLRIIAPVVLILSLIPLIFCLKQKYFAIRSHDYIMREYIQAHFDKDQKVLDKWHSSKVEQYWDLNNPSSEDITSRNISVWTTTSSSKLLIDSIATVDSPLYHIYYSSFKEDESIGKKAIMTIKIINQKVSKVYTEFMKAPAVLSKAPKVKDEISKPKQPEVKSRILKSITTNKSMVKKPKLKERATKKPVVSKRPPKQSTPKIEKVIKSKKNKESAGVRTYENPEGINKE